MQTYSFQIIVRELNESLVESLYSRCPDASAGTTCGVAYVAFDRESDSMDAAVRSAWKDLRSVGIRPQRATGERRVVWDMLGMYFAIMLWEVLTTPMISHSNSWHGVWVSLLALPAAAFWLAGRRSKVSWFFLFGAGGSLLFVFRFLNMDRFSLWLQYQSPSTTIIMTCWVMFTLGLGTVCWVAAAVRSEVDESFKTRG